MRRIEARICMIQKKNIESVHPRDQRRKRSEQSNQACEINEDRETIRKLSTTKSRSGRKIREQGQVVQFHRDSEL